MNKKKHFVVLGLGTFGTSLARRLCENGCRVTGVDRDPQRVESLKHMLYEAVVADATELMALQEMDVKSADAVLISLGENGNMSPSLMAVLHARELGARKLIVKGLNAEHGKILEKLGVDRVVFPDSEIALQLADRATWPNVLDYLSIDSEYAIVEIAIPESLIGKTLQEGDLRNRHHVWVFAIKDALSGKLKVFPGPDSQLTSDQALLLVGSHEALDRFRDVK